MESAERSILLTDHVVGDLNPYFPLRSMYLIGATGKYVAEQTLEEEHRELDPLYTALKKLMQHLL
ncbi:MAG: hypothetical protein UU08_C0036G0003 [Candidatus Uhrbacteria bacterium GW2011_GWE2_40_58]|nr:MAG: hypothetical protein UT94_C0059G0003 [Candidatus Uhrbacteria bacterium GW2011_GWF2_40_263]KKR66672.1 MAG: hypothetical protein UU08_C0036G0003 [Candidatus Uhrbacteria bacterium GW2011_GWE2_40_58]OGL92343.1 MAG: hypothetical protein A2239_00015 [Candidatus Uhrbacteria bacterium RIFOXYA2_FULL_40_9]OGL96695.1 MAG: hypothetical protein A2332_04940 [Candidatus Uhrbacteria bacterium RIFOXYB2_FULL_41_18]HBK34465.1 hypothetical protein [Candidatus Uhrbacteria bacterium]